MATTININGVEISLTGDAESAFLDNQTAISTVAAAAILVAAAKAALDTTDAVLIRCLKAGVSWPAIWQTYVVALRAIVANPASATSLPAPPAYPAGT